MEQWRVGNSMMVIEDEMINSPLFWSNKQQYTRNGDSSESTADYSIITDTIDLPDIFYDPSSLLHGIKTNTTFVRDASSEKTCLPTPSTSDSLISTTIASLTDQLQESSWLTEDTNLTISEPLIQLDSQTPHSSPFPALNSFGKCFASSSCAHQLCSVAGEKEGDVSATSSHHESTSNIWLSHATTYKSEAEAIKQAKEIIYREAVMRPVIFGPESTQWDRPKRKKMRLSNDPQTAAARKRRERISDKLWVLKRLVPGGSSMDTATMLDEAANYLRFLKSQLSSVEN